LSRHRPPSHHYEPGLLEVGEQVFGDDPRHEFISAVMLPPAIEPQRERQCEHAAAKTRSGDRNESARMVGRPHSVVSPDAGRGELWCAPAVTANRLGRSGVAAPNVFAITSLQFGPEN